VVTVRDAAASLIAALVTGLSLSFELDELELEDEDDLDELDEDDLEELAGGRDVDDLPSALAFSRSLSAFILASLSFSSVDVLEVEPDDSTVDLE